MPAVRNSKAYLTLRGFSFSGPRGVGFYVYIARGHRLFIKSLHRGAEEQRFLSHPLGDRLSRWDAGRWAWLSLCFTRHTHCPPGAPSARGCPGLYPSKPVHSAVPTGVRFPQHVGAAWPEAWRDPCDLGAHSSFPDTKASWKKGRRLRNSAGLTCILHILRGFP